VLEKYGLIIEYHNRIIDESKEWVVDDVNIEVIES
jgi:hypothetical protein